MKILFKNATIYTLNNNSEVLYNTDLLVCDGVIAQINKNINVSADRTIDCANKLLMPGFVNAYFNDGAVKKDTYKQCANNYLHMVKNGITTCFECTSNPRDAVMAMADVGIRGFIAVGGITGKEIIDTDTVYNQVKDLQKINPHVNPILFAKNVNECNEDVFSTLVKCATKFNWVLSTQCSRTLEEVGDIYNKYGLTPVGLLESYGFFDTKCVLLHCVHCDKEDVDILSNYDVCVATCPCSNLMDGSGVAPVYSFNKKHVTICLGTGELLNNARPNMIRNMYLACNLQAGVLNEANIISASKAIKMATINGANSLGLTDVARLEIGYKADIIMMDILPEDLYPVSVLEDVIVNGMDSSDICLTMINGIIVYESGKYNVNLNQNKCFK